MRIKEKITLVRLLAKLRSYGGVEMNRESILQIIMICIAIVMIVSPVDIVPDAIPLIGHLDDIIYIMVGARQAMNMLAAPKEVQ